MTTLGGPMTSLRPPVFTAPATATIGAEPKTRELANYEAAVETFRPTSRKTPRGQPLAGDAKRGGRFLALCSVLLAIAGIAAEIACMLAAVSGAQQVEKLNWPLADGQWTWDKCNFLPNSDAPATSYGSSISVFFHALNVLVFVGMMSYLVRFATRPVADYGIGVSGLFMFWLGLGLASRWVGTVQLIVGALLIAFGFFNFIFGFDKFIEAAKEAYTGKKKPPPKPKAAPKSEAQSNAEKARDLSRAMESYKISDPYAHYYY